MTLLMLCREPRLYSCQRLKQAAEAKGFQVDILDPQRFLLRIEQGKFGLFYQQGEVYDKPRCEPKPLGDYAGVLPRFGVSATEIGCHILRHFEYRQIPVLNTAQAFTLARHKWQSLQVLNAHGIPTPSTVLAGELYGTMETLQQFPLPSVIKTLSGSQGCGVMLADNQNNAVSLLNTLHTAKVPTLLQAFISESQGQDIRVFVVGDEIVAAMQRRSAKGEFRANIHQGGSASPVELTAEERQLAIKATQVIGLDVAGVDLIRSQQGTMVLEVNAAPGLEMIERINQVDIASRMVERLLAKIS